MRLCTLWVVRDPSPDSTIEDILHRCEADRIAHLCVGTGVETWVAEHTALYAHEAEARIDAQARLDEMERRS